MVLRFESVGYLRAGGKSVQLPCATSAAIPMLSLIVGCGWMVCYVAALGRYDMLPNYMCSTDYTRFAQDTFVREKALIEKLGLAKGQ